MFSIQFAPTDFLSPNRPQVRSFFRYSAGLACHSYRNTGIFEICNHAAKICQEGSRDSAVVLGLGHNYSELTALAMNHTTGSGALVANRRIGFQSPI
jgi:hypothetical protein